MAKLLANLIFEPKGKHDPTQPYTIKDTVMSADGSQVYFALQNVPIGIQLNNTEYWKLQIDLSETKADMEAATDAANAAAEDASQLSGQVEQISGDVDRLTEEIADINKNLCQPIDVEFTVKKDGEHSSKNDQILVSCKKGQRYFVTVETSSNNCGGISLFEYANGIGTSAYDVKPNVENEFVATTDFESLGLYIVGNTEDCIYKFHCETEDTVSGKRYVRFKEDISNRLDLFVISVNPNDIEQGVWEYGVGVNEQLRLKTKGYYKVERGFTVTFNSDGLYTNIIIYENEPSGKSQTAIESSGWFGGDGEYEYKIGNSGYALINFANGADYTQSTPITPTDYKADTLIWSDIIRQRSLEVLNDYLEQPIDVEFTVKKDGEHSSKNDQILVNCKKGQRYFVTVETSSNNCGGISLFEYANGIGTSAYDVKPNVENEFVATTDFESLGLYIVGNTEDCIYKFHCETENTVSPRRMAELRSKLENYGLPEYWTEHLTDKILSVNNITSSCAIHGDSFIFFTDYHLEQSSGYSHLLMRDIVDQTSVDKVVFGGDIFNGSDTHDGAMAKISEYLRRFKPLNVYGARGNHEYNWNDGGSVDVQLTDSEIYNALLKGVESNAKTNGGLSCYFDNENQKIRYILLDSHYENDNDVIPQSECEWLQERLRELESGWTVIVFTHVIFGMSYEESQAGNVVYASNGQRIVNAINDIKEEMSATLACVICGHVHYDYSNTDNGYLIITTTCDSKQGRGQWVGWGKGSGTVLEHAFDVFSVDTVNRTIKTVRVGRGENREWNY